MCQLPHILTHIVGPQEVAAETDSWKDEGKGGSSLGPALLPSSTGSHSSGWQLTWMTVSPFSSVTDLMPLKDVTSLFSPSSCTTACRGQKRWPVRKGLAGSKAFANEVGSQAWVSADNNPSLLFIEGQSPSSLTLNRSELYLKTKRSPG